jgi:hypothetical protein
MRRAWSTNGELRNAHMLSMKESEGKRSLERTRRMWVDDIKMDVG